jgi:hypothetical protein
MGMTLQPTFRICFHQNRHKGRPRAAYQLAAGRGLQQLGVVWQAKEEFDDALSDYGQAINLDSRPAGAWNNRGIRRLPLGQGEAA